MQKIKPTAYSDGVLTVYRERSDARTSFGARVRPTGVEDMDRVVKLCFAERSKREQDLDFAEGRGFELSLKVATPRVDGVDSKCKALVDGTLYDVRYVDQSKRELFIYLQEVGPVDTR